MAKRRDGKRWVRRATAEREEGEHWVLREPMLITAFYTLPMPALDLLFACLGPGLRRVAARGSKPWHASFWSPERSKLEIVQIREGGVLRDHFRLPGGNDARCLLQVPGHLMVSLGFCDMQGMHVYRVDGACRSEQAFLRVRGRWELVAEGHRLVVLCSFSDEAPRLGRRALVVLDLRRLEGMGVWLEEAAFGPAGIAALGEEELAGARRLADVDLEEVFLPKSAGGVAAGLREKGLEACRRRAARRGEAP